MTPEQAAKVLEKLVLELQHRSPEVDELEQSYRGEYRLRFASSDFAEFFGDRYRGFSDNWTQVVADAPHERLQVIGIRHGDADKGDTALWDTWLRNEADYFSDMAMLDAIIAKRSFALVWGDENDKATITWEHPGQAVVAYDPETKKRRYGAKCWVEDDIECATLYTPTEVWKFDRPRTRSNETLEVVLPISFIGGWRMREVPGETWPIENPIGEVPLVELPNKPRLIGEPLSDIAGTLSMQHAINLLWAELFNAADFMGMPARVVLGAEKPVVPVLNADGVEIATRPVELKKFRSNRVTWLEDPNAKIDTWPAAELDNWTKVIEKAVAHIASQTRTPAHYLMAGGTFANISADAMKALETGLVKRTEEKTQSFGRAVREIFRLVALVEGDAAKAASVALGEVRWKDVENRSDAQLVDALQKRHAIGYPFQYLLERDGLSDTEIQRVMAMVEAEQNDPIVGQILGKVNAGNGATGVG